MAIDNQILTQTWEDMSKGNIEDGLKALLTAILAALDEPAAEGSVGLTALTQQLRDLVNNAVPNTRKVNNKPLSENVTLGASDVGAMPANAVVVKRITVNGDEVENNNGTVALVIEGGGTADLSQVFGKVEFNSNTKRINFYSPDAVIGTDAPIGYIDASALVNPTMDSTPTAGNTSHTVSSDGVAAAIAQAGGQVTVTTNQDGTFTIHAADDYTINLNHTHPNMAKLVITDEEPSDPALDTIYALVDDATTPTAIQSLWIAGLEFVGGGGSSTEPKIVSPVGTNIDFEGGQTKTITVRAVNITGALSLSVTGDFTVTANGSPVSSISASDAINGVSLLLTKGSNFDGGSLGISSSVSEFTAKSFNVVDSLAYQPITAVKFTKQQYVELDIKPGPNTRLEIDMQFDGEATTPDRQTTDETFIGGGSDSSYNPAKVFLCNTSGAPGGPNDLIIFSETSSDSAQIQLVNEKVLTRSTLIIDMVNKQASFNGQTVSIAEKTTTMPNKMKFGSNSGGTKPFGRRNIIVYSLKHYENNVPTHEYLPYTYYGIPGLYDTKTNTFISSGTQVPLVSIQNS